MAEQSLTPAQPQQPSQPSSPPRQVAPAPSPPWYGGVSTALLALMVVILLTYTLLDWQWQQDLGWWNYVAVGVLIVVTSALMANWRADLNRNLGDELDDPNEDPAGTHADLTTKRIDPARAGHGRVDAPREDPAGADPVRVDPARVDAARADSSREDSAGADPARRDPAGPGEG